MYRRILVALLLAVVVIGCGKQSAEKPDAPVTTSKIADISSNHGHRALLTAAQLTAGAAVTISIRLGADHDHNVTFSGDDVISIRRGNKLSRVSSTTNGHNHTVTFNPGA